MRHRIHYPGDLNVPEVSVTGEEQHHASRVVRLREGEEVELLDGRGAVMRGKVLESGRDVLRVALEGPVPSRESSFAITLAMAIIQLERFELVLQKATELGVHAIVPVVTERVEIRSERYRGKAERWEKIIFEGVKQSGRAVIPSIEGPAPFEDVVRRSHHVKKLVIPAAIEDRFAISGGFDRDRALCRAFLRQRPRAGKGCAERIHVVQTIRAVEACVNQDRVTRLHFSHAH